MCKIIKSVLTQAEDKDVLLFSKQDFHTYPDVWRTNSQFDDPIQITQLNPHVADFKWGGKPELVVLV